MSVTNTGNHGCFLLRLLPVKAFLLSLAVLVTDSQTAHALIAKQLMQQGLQSWFFFFFKLQICLTEVLTVCEHCKTVFI